MSMNVNMYVCVENVSKWHIHVGHWWRPTTCISKQLSVIWFLSCTMQNVGSLFVWLFHVCTCSLSCVGLPWGNPREISWVCPTSKRQGVLFRASLYTVIHNIVVKLEHWLLWVLPNISYTTSVDCNVWCLNSHTCIVCFNLKPKFNSTCTCSYTCTFENSTTYTCVCIQTL